MTTSFVTRGRKDCVVTFIDFAGAFDSVSHKFLDEALWKAGASRKSHALFRSIYKAASGTARVLGLNGKNTYSHTFNIERGVIQGDIMSPIFFIIALDQLMQRYDTSGEGIRVGNINEIRVLGYADDIAMIGPSAAALTDRLTTFANESLQRADMQVKLKKTFTQVVKEQEPVDKATEEEIEEAEAKFDFKCEYASAGCQQKFKTQKGARIHSCNCAFRDGLGVTEEEFTVDRITAVFGKKERRMFKVKWTDHPGKDSWEFEETLKKDGCKESIDDFWATSRKNPARDFYPDKTHSHRCWICGWTSKAQDEQMQQRCLKAHITRSKHQWKRKRAHITAAKIVEQEKRKALQKELPHVYWDEKQVKNSRVFKYLGSQFCADGDQLHDVKARVAMAVTRAGKLRTIWREDLPLKLKLRLYKSACCSILAYGSEAWTLDAQTCALINGANATMLSHITGRSPQDEASKHSTTFNIISWIRARRLRWVGHILRLHDEKKPHEGQRLLFQTAKHIFEHPQDGDLMMDAPTDDWQDLLIKAKDRQSWRQLVNATKCSTAPKRKEAQPRTEGPTTRSQTTQRKKAAESSDIAQPSTTTPKFTIQ